MCPKRCRHTGCRIIIIKLHQRRYFTDEMSIVIRMRHGEEVSRRSSSKISNLDPLLDENEVLRVGGRIKQSNLNTENIHSILLSGKGIATNLLVKWYHQFVGHGGRGYTFNKIRSSEYWIVKANSLVQSFIVRCVRCRYLCGKERLENRKWQIFQQTEIAQNHLLRMLGLTCLIHLWSNTTERK